jgi:hypothetical protein
VCRATQKNLVFSLLWEPWGSQDGPAQSGLNLSNNMTTKIEEVVVKEVVAHEVPELEVAAKCLERSKDEQRARVRRELRKIARIKDPVDAQEQRDFFVTCHVPWNLLVLDAMLKDQRNSRYATIDGLQATDLFIECYVKLLKDWDYPHQDVPSTLAECDSQMLLDFWQARQVADHLGLEYREYLASVFEPHDEIYGRRPTPEYLRSCRAVELSQEEDDLLPVLHT